MMPRLAILLLVLIASANGALADDRSDACGYVYPVRGYQAEIDGVRIELPANDRLVVNGRKLAEYSPFLRTKSAAAWVDSGNTAKIATTLDEILILTNSNDCIDVSLSRIFVLDRTGALRATSELWSEHDAYAGFSKSAAGLMFSSDWLCSQDSGAPKGRAHVYFLANDSKVFKREEREWNEVCSPEGRRTLQQLYFAPMEPILPVRK